MTTYNKEYYEKNKDKFRAAHRRWCAKNLDYIKQSQLDYAAQNRAKMLLAVCKQRAARKGIEFELTEQDIIIPTHCPYLGVELTSILGKGRQAYNPSIDRKDPLKGYSPDNIQIISDLANRMKQNATTEQLVAFAKGVLKLHNES